MAVSLKSIAEKCGVTPATVSLALQDNPRISVRRRHEIHAVAEELGYRSNIIAQSLRGGRSHSIGILWSLTGPHDSLSLIRNMTLPLRHRGYVSYVADSMSDAAVIRSSLQDYAARKADGLIMQLYHNDALLREDREVAACLREIGNVVIVDEQQRHGLSTTGGDRICRSREDAFESIIAYWQAAGRRKIALLRPIQMVERDELFVHLLQRYGFPVEDWRLGCFALEEIKMAPEDIERLLAGNWDAVIAANDELAADLIALLTDHGLKVPDDIAVCGFNDNIMSRHFRPALASVDRRSDELASMAVEMLLRRIEQPDAPAEFRQLPMRFVLRASAGHERP